MSARTAARFGIALLVALVAGRPHPAASQELENLPAPLAYRRIFVPANEIAAWPLNGEKFVPIDARDFQNSVVAANRTVSGTDTRASAATITDAVYTARFDKSGQLSSRTAAVNGRLHDAAWRRRSSLSPAHR
jgi:hypothetical protein